MSRLQKILEKRMERVEDSATYLINIAELFNTTNNSLWDMKNMRQSLLSAGRAYGKSLAALARPIK